MVKCNLFYALGDKTIKIQSFSPQNGELALFPFRIIEEKMKENRHWSAEALEDQDLLFKERRSLLCKIENF
jgi:hypothetical protein